MRQQARRPAPVNLRRRRRSLRQWQDANRDVPRGFVSLAEEVREDYLTARRQRDIAIQEARATRALPVCAVYVHRARAWQRVLLGAIWRMRTLGLVAPEEEGA